MPTRKIKKSYRSVTGVLASQKNSRMIASESSLERDLFLLLEFDPMIKSFEEQPVTLPYHLSSGLPSRYTPDVIINFQDSPSFIWEFSPFRTFFAQIDSSELTKSNGFVLKTKSARLDPDGLLVEVKFREELFDKWSELKPKFKAARKYSQERNWDFRVLTEKEIRTQLLSNIKFIRPFRRYQFTVEELFIIIDKLADTGRCSVKDLLNSLSNDAYKQGELIPKIWHLISRHQIRLNWNQPITLNTILTPII